ncbi:hypothetical protein [Enterococcus sp. AZ103]|uniref:hypothetical protein n=1 Tax=Enterococcus sp. AZ103 TaxID=2774628 RepID=UPI003F2261FD
MDYEIVGIIETNNPIWEKQKKRVQNNRGKLISILPDLEFDKKLFDEKVEGLNIINKITEKSYDPAGFLFFNKIPTSSEAEIFVNENWSISVVHNGEEIGQVILFPNTRRHVKQVKYFNIDNSIDFIEEYASDGKLFSIIYYHDNKIQEIAYMNDQKIPVLNYYFYNEDINFVTISDPSILEVTHKYQNSIEFLAVQLANILQEDDTVNFSYMGIELLALSKSKSRNILNLEESPFTEDGQVKGNLLGILENRIPYVQEVKMSQDYFVALKNKNISVDKVKVIESNDRPVDSLAIK